MSSFFDHRVQAVNFPDDPYPIHIDATFTSLWPGLILTNPQGSLPHEKRKMFEKNDWEIIDEAQPAPNTPPPLCYSSTWLSMKVLVLDPKTVCVEKSEAYQAEQMDKLGIEVSPVDPRDAYAFGGGSIGGLQMFFAKDLAKTTFQIKLEVRKLYDTKFKDKMLKNWYRHQGSK